jgi:hypothetical protein
MYEVMTPEGLAVSYSHSALAVIVEKLRSQAPVQMANERLRQVRPILELGNADTDFESIPGHKEMGLFVDESTSQSSHDLASGPTTLGPITMLPCSPQEQSAFSQNPVMSGLDESDHMSTSQSNLGLPHIVLDWTQVQLPLRSDGIDRLVQPMLFDPSVGWPYQDLEGTMPVMADLRHMHASRGPPVVTRASTSDHPRFARRSAARGSTRNWEKSHGS